MNVGKFKPVLRYARMSQNACVCLKINAAYENISQPKKKCASVYLNSDNTGTYKGLTLVHIADIKACNMKQQIKIIK